MRRTLHVYPRPFGIYEFRRQIPEELRPAFGSRRWHIRSLGTKDLKEANKLAAAVEIEFDEQEALARSGEWPPRCDEEIELLVHDWWLIARPGTRNVFTNRGYRADRTCQIPPETDSAMASR